MSFFVGGEFVIFVSRSRCDEAVRQGSSSSIDNAFEASLILRFGERVRCDSCKVSSHNDILNCDQPACTFARWLRSDIALS